MNKLLETEFNSKILLLVTVRYSAEQGGRRATNIETSLGAVVPQKTQVRWIHARSNKYVQVFVNDILQLQHDNAAIQ